MLSDRTGSALPTATGRELALPNEAISPLLARLLGCSPIFRRDDQLATLVVASFSVPLVEALTTVHYTQHT